MSKAPTKKAAAADAAAAELVTVEATTTIDHDGVRYEPGDELEVTPAQAEALIRASAARPVPAAPPAEGQ